jgi:hypothetical protein
MDETEKLRGATGIPPEASKCPRISANAHFSQTLSQAANDSFVKKKARKKAAPNKAPRKDASQTAHSIVELVIGGKLRRPV